MVSDAADVAAWGTELFSGEVLGSMGEQLFAEPVVVVEDAVWMGLGAFVMDEAYDGVDPQMWHNGAINGYGIVDGPPAWLGHHRGRARELLAGDFPGKLRPHPSPEGRRRDLGDPRGECRGVAS